MANSNRSNGSICMVVALPAEADPLIRHFDLKQENNGLPFQWFRRGNYVLVVSGIGKFSSAAALGFAYAQLDGPRQCAWLNIGIAGHSHASRGEIFHAAKITDGNYQRYPICNFNPPTTPETVITVDKAECRFEQRGAYDMEASGFAVAATRLSSVELVHSIKVISDGPAIAPTPIRSAMVRELIQQHCETIEIWCSTLLELSHAENARLQVPPGLQDFYKRWHFTVTQQHQLEQQLRRWHARFPEQSPLKALTSCSDANSVIEGLEDRLSPVWPSI